MALFRPLVDGGEALWKSNAVLRYLFARYGKVPLQPADPIVRARGRLDRLVLGHALDTGQTAARAARAHP